RERERSRPRRSALYGAIALAAFIFIVPGTATAQTESVEEIIVIARKRPETLSAVPQTVTVYSAADLAAAGDTVSGDIAERTPNLMWHSIFGFATPQLFLRGIGNTTFNANQASPVGLHVDSVYQGSSIGYGFALLDLDRVEILKGPQGTL